MIFLSWSLAHFISVVAIATTISVAILPIAFSSISAQTIRKITFLLAIVFSIFIFIALFYWISPAFLPHVILHFNQASIPLFVATLIISQLLILHAIIHLNENVAQSLCTATAIVAGFVLTFVFPLQEQSTLPFFAVVITTSFFVDLLIFSQIMQKKYFIVRRASNTFFVALNTAVMVITSAALSYDIPDTIQHFMLIVAALIASGFTPFFSYWRYITLFNIPNPSLYVACFQTLITIHILSQINFFSFLNGYHQASYSNYILVALLVSAFVISVIPNRKNRIQKPVRAIATCMIIATIAISIHMPPAVLHIQILLFFSFPTFLLLLQQKTLPITPALYSMHLIAVVLTTLFYWPVLFYYHSFSSVFLPPTTLYDIAQEISKPSIFFVILSIIILYNAYALLPFLRAKKTTIPKKKVAVIDNNKYILISAFTSIFLLHTLFIFIPQ